MMSDRPIAAATIPLVLRRLGTTASVALGAVAVGLIRMADEPSAWAQTPCAPTHIAADDGDVLKRSELGYGSIFIGACAQGLAEIKFGDGPYSDLTYVNRQTQPNPPWYTSQQVFEPCTFAGGSDIPGSVFRVKYTSGNPSADFAFTGYLARDSEAPTLKAEWEPAKANLVWPGVMIRVNMGADERYDARRKGWQGGVKKIQLTDESQGRGQEVPPSYQNDGPMQPCGRKMWQNSIAATYTVPRTPPPTVRLVARAWDFADNKDDDTGLFPTSDWFGTITASVEGNIYNDTAVITFGIKETADGIWGRGHVKVSSAEAEVGNCKWTRTISQRDFDVPITGRRVGSDLRLVLSRIGPKPTTWLHTSVCTPPITGPRRPVTVAQNALATILDHNEAIIVPARDGWEAALPTSPPSGGVKWTLQIIIHRTRP
jgi:hypothetical protein